MQRTRQQRSESKDVLANYFITAVWTEKEGETNKEEEKMHGKCCRDVCTALASAGFNGSLLKEEANDRPH